MDRSKSTSSQPKRTPRASHQHSAPQPNPSHLPVVPEMRSASTHRHLTLVGGTRTKNRQWKQEWSLRCTQSCSWSPKSRQVARSSRSSSWKRLSPLHRLIQWLPRAPLRCAHSQHQLIPQASKCLVPSNRMRHDARCLTHGLAWQQHCGLGYTCCLRLTPCRCGRGMPSCARWPRAQRRAFLPPHQNQKRV